MKFSLLSCSLAAFGLTMAPALAGAPAKELAPAEVSRRTWFPDDPAGSFTLGGLFSEHLTGVYLDSITGLWAPEDRDAFLFLNSRYHYEDDGQFISSTGLGFRKLWPEREVIVGGNVFYDSLHSAFDNDFQQLGLGVEVLTRWVDARFNYYLPDNDQYEIGRSTTRDSERSLSSEFVSNGFINRDLSEISRTRSFKRYEAALEGWNGEIGFLIPGLDRYAEVRLYGGYYHYDNPFGSDFEGFKARLEARVLPGLIADLEYWNDEELMGGHWTAGVRVTVPFSIAKLVTGRNPFEGIGEYFTPRRREFRERMGDMVMRSHRLQTTTSGDLPAGDSSTSETTTLPIRPVPKPAPPRRVSGGGGDGFPPE